jgi:tryptophan-rich sensory protein
MYFVKYFFNKLYYMTNILLYSVLIPIVLALIMNGIIYTFGLNKYDSKNIVNPLIPPGYIIGTIWIIILGLLGYVHYLLYKINNKISLASVFTIFIILFCISYPLLTGLKQKSGLLLNLITLILAFILGLLVIIESKYIFIFVVPLIVWASYVNVAYVIQCSQFY